MAYVDPTAALRANISQNNAQLAQNDQQFQAARTQALINMMLQMAEASKDRDFRREENKADREVRREEGAAETERHRATLQTQRDIATMQQGSIDRTNDRTLKLREQDAEVAKRMIAAISVEREYTALGPSDNFVEKSWEDELGLEERLARTTAGRIVATTALKNQGTASQTIEQLQQLRDEYQRKGMQYILTGTRADISSRELTNVATSQPVTPEVINNTLSSAGAYGDAESSAAMKNVLNLAYAYGEAKTPKESSNIAKQLRAALWGDPATKTAGVGEQGAFILTRNLTNTINDLRAKVASGAAVGAQGGPLQTGEAPAQPMDQDTALLEQNIANLQKVFGVLNAAYPGAVTAAIRNTKVAENYNRLLQGNVDPTLGLNPEVLRELTYTALVNGTPEEMEKLITEVSSVRGMDPRREIYAKEFLKYAAQTRPEFLSVDQLAADQKVGNEVENAMLTDYVTEKRKNHLIFERLHTIEAMEKTIGHLKPLMQTAPDDIADALEPLAQRLKRIDAEGAKLGVDFGDTVVPFNVHKFEGDVAKARANATASAQKARYEEAAAKFAEGLTQHRVSPLPAQPQYDVNIAQPPAPTTQPGPEAAIPPGWHRAPMQVKPGGGFHPIYERALTPDTWSPGMPAPFDDRVPPSMNPYEYAGYNRVPGRPMPSFGPNGLAGQNQESPGY